MIQCIPEQGLNDRLPAHIEPRGAFVKFAQHALSQIDVHPAYGPNDRELVGEELGNIFPTRGHTGNLIGRGGTFRFVWHRLPLLAWWLSRRSSADTDGTKLLRIVTLPIHNVGLIENLLSLF
jgi:hypothetical protein